MNILASMRHCRDVLSINGFETDAITLNNAIRDFKKMDGIRLSADLDVAREALEVARTAARFGVNAPEEALAAVFDATDAALSRLSSKEAAGS